MLELAAELRQWALEGRDFAVATVVAVHGSAPRPPGAALAVNDEGTVIGSVSGGCVEGAVYELCRTALDNGLSTLERFGHSDQDAFAIGLTCGGVIDILVTPVTAAQRPHYLEAWGAAAGGEPVTLVRTLAAPFGVLLVRADGTGSGTLAHAPGLDRTAPAEAVALRDTGFTGVTELGSRCAQRVPVFVESSVPAPRMIVFGAIDFAAALVRAGKFLGYRVTVCDARPVFATAARFPEADEVVADWPHRYLDAQHLDGRAVLCVLTHDAKFDVPLLERALRLPVAYVGAMGSRRTHQDRLNRLREAGLSVAELARLHSPIGLDLGARTPEETALSIAAEIVAVRRGGSGVPLSGAAVPIHHDGPPSAAGRTPGSAPELMPGLRSARSGVRA
ncbi:XdhC family protein [Streptomyces orinoci]|uniref:XdhC/CoxI family protein n=1 Tax=Streptomyces orinoci TaxID=67339 RepID=A0ABV3JZK7_STRON|nr:XdhC/CoxI family protein [Streptomyces orinoci]